MHNNNQNNNDSRKSKQYMSMLKCWVNSFIGAACFLGFYEYLSHKLIKCIATIWSGTRNHMSAYIKLGLYNYFVGNSTQTWTRGSNWIQGTGLEIVVDWVNSPTADFTLNNARCEVSKKDARHSFWTNCTIFLG